MRAYYTSKDSRKFGDMSYESKYLMDPKYMTKRDLQHYYKYYNMTRNRGQFKKIVIIIFCVCVFSYLFVDYNLRTQLLRLRDRFDFIARIDDEYNNGTQAYFLDTPGCRMPHFEEMDETVSQFLFNPSDVKCPKPLTRTSETIAGQLLLNLNAQEQLKYYKIKNLLEISCHYREIRRVNDNKNQELEPVPFKLAEVMQLPKNLEFMCMSCKDTSGSEIYSDCHFFVVDKPDNGTIHKRKRFKRVSFNNTNNNSNNHEHSSSSRERLSVMVLGIDSVSHLNFLRQMHRTSSFIRNNLSHVEFWGFNKVGDNTFPNLVPLLSGLTEQELNISCVAPMAMPSFDGCSFLWKRYKQAGYRTVFAEDVSSLGVFQFDRVGFRRQPTDYYFHPMMTQMEARIASNKVLNVNVCMGGRRTADVLFEYLRKFVPKMQHELFFSFFWSVTLTHDKLNWPRLLDVQLTMTLQRLQESGVLNRTLLLLMSDHGMRWGSFRNTYQGMMEERQPLLIALYPGWLKKRYPLAIANLELNAKRLITPFDLHATLLQLLDMRNLEPERLQQSAAELHDADSTLQRGISLFLPVPAERNCEQADIAAHWCTCYQRKELATNDARVQRAARYLVRLINSRLSAHSQCRTLYLNSILQALIAAPHKKIVKDITSDYGVDITLRFQTKPGLAVFESTVRMTGFTSALTGTISRINLYGSQSYCIKDAALKMFCYCHR
ncbi:hypothetical protein AWZ03_006889 [Drosophila navojoa]|uniref:Uncharacterized protein n=2 Tax=Drosophila navojoa TaxID=7232 RepID=A0A484BDB9_DRONA|nr:uncharacterized protein LOC108649682 isoform X1 [Drosophila navojoa]TDG46709.1 hypothetical protein AWZ03_006889 [Drosophila navojoa]